MTAHIAFAIYAATSRPRTMHGYTTSAGYTDNGFPAHERPHEGLCGLDIRELASSALARRELSGWPVSSVPRTCS